MIPVTLSKSLIELLTGGLPDFFSACEKAAQYLLSGFFSDPRQFRPLVGFRRHVMQK
jgi:hypothetical protein